MHTIRDCLGETYFALCKTFDTPRSLAMYLMWKHGEHLQLLSHDIKAVDYLQTDVASFHADYQCLNYIKKNVVLDTGIDLEEAALRSFKTAESQNLKTNIRLNQLYGSKDPAAHVLNVAERKIQKILGEFRIEEFCESVGWGSGATSSLPKARAQIDNRLAEKHVRLSSRSWRLFNKAMSSDLNFHRARGIPASGPLSLVKSEFHFDDSEVFDTVPKNAKTHRGICKGPTASIFMQKGVGTMIRRRLRHWGIDLNDQSHNQILAQKAMDQRLCTVDLSMASDTVSHELVRWLLPDDWFMVLEALRAKTITLPDSKTYVLQRFSSMGNGFTFELESLVFFAIVDAINRVYGFRNLVSVYGDDIITGQESYNILVNTFEVAGFSVNTDKSYHEGVFFESCGAHYFNGSYVTPAYQKEAIDSYPKAHRAANRLVRTNETHYSLAYSNAREVILRRFKPKFVQPLHSQSDDAYILSFKRARKCFQDSCPNRGIKVKALIPKTAKRKSRNDYSLLSVTLRWPQPEGLGFWGRVPLSVTTFSSRRRWFREWDDPLCDIA